MHPTLRIVALASALSALSPVASAAQVTLNFDELGTQADALGQPIGVPDTGGLRFGGAYVYGQSMLVDIPGFDNLDFVSAGRGGIVLNRAGGTTTNSDIIVSLVQQTTTARTTAADPVVFFQAITFNLFTKGTGNSNRLIATGVTGDESNGMTSGGQDNWSLPQTFTFDPLDQVTSLRFTAGGAAFALDNMVFTLSTTNPGGNVPEPASFGLVGLALLGAGAASRRKQQA